MSRRLEPVELVGHPIGGRMAVAVVVALAASVAVASCRGSGAGRTADPRREAVKAFWAKLRAANDARLRSGCASALVLYEEALVLDPRHEDALYYLGQCRRESGRPVEARKAFERLVEVNPASARGHLALGALLASPDPTEPMDLAAAEAHLRRAHEINGEETGPVVRLGEVLLVRGQDAEARRWLEAALRTNPKSVEAAFLAGLSAGGGSTADAGALARRVADAARVETPVKGVLNEGDRRDPKRAAAPPLASPLGRLLFGAPIAKLRGRAAAGETIDAAVLDGLWREARRLRSELAARGSRSPGIAPATAAASATS